jgi:hypothetical protein
MEITTFLMQLWGPVLLAIGIGFFTSRKYYVKIYRDLEKQSFAIFMFAIIAIAAGIAQIQAHNVWGNFSEVVVSILGWGLLIKGIIFAVAPRFVDRTATEEAKSGLVPVAGFLMIMLGAYLTLAGF